MTPEEFAAEFTTLKESLLRDYFSSDSEISRVRVLEGAGLNEKQIQVVKALSEDLLTDALYTVLLGLDGCASIGDIQESYTVKDESNHIVAGDGELESYAWEAFHGNNT